MSSPGQRKLSTLFRWMLNSATTMERKILNTRPHFTPIDYNSLSRALSDIVWKDGTDVAKALKEAVDFALASNKYADAPRVSIAELSKMELPKRGTTSVLTKAVITNSKGVPIGVFGTRYLNVQPFIGTMSKYLEKYASKEGETHLLNAGHAYSSQHSSLTTPVTLNVNYGEQLISDEGAFTANAKRYMSTAGIFESLRLYGPNSPYLENQEPRIARWVARNMEQAPNAEKLTYKWKFKEKAEKIPDYVRKALKLPGTSKGSEKEIASLLSSLQVSENYGEIVSKINDSLGKAYAEFSGSVSGELASISLELDKEVLDTLARFEAVIVISQNAKTNRELGQSLEKAVKKDLNIIVEILADYGFSPKFTDQMADALIDNVMGKKSKNKKSKAKVSESIKGPKAPAVAVGATIATRTFTKKQRQAASRRAKVALRETTGRFASLVNIQALLQYQLHDRLKENMHRPHLIYRTGRFARSVQVENLQRDPRTGAVTAFLTYMKYPYQTFEPGYAQGHKGYDPRTLIDKTVREIAVELIKNRLKVVHV